MLEECYDHLEEPEPVQLIRAGLVAAEAELAHNDETGLYVQGHRQWLHVMSNSELTYYEYHLKRGKAATDEIGLLPLPLFKGTSVHDSWSPYWGYTAPARFVQRPPAARANLCGRAVAPGLGHSMHKNAVGRQRAGRKRAGIRPPWPGCSHFSQVACALH